MFALRGIAVSCSVFVMVYCILSLAVSLTWSRFRLWTRQHPSHRIADMLFALRILPVATAVVITAAFTVPSFLLLEPRSIDEPIGGAPLTLGIFGVALAMVGVANAARSVLRASRAIKVWTAKAEAANLPVPLPALRISPAVPAMTAVGILRPRLLVSGSAERLLTADELQTALNHEVAHARRRDNLKKFLICLVPFPGMGGLDLAWLEVTEMAADDVAVSNAAEALDLAAALIKLSRLGPVEPQVDLTAAIVHSPASIMNARIERLIAWSEERRVPAHRSSLWYGVAAAFATGAAFIVTYSQLLQRIHAATEWLVR